METINQLRKDNKGKWYTFQGIINGKEVEVKGYDTWLQIFKVNGISNSSNMDISVKDYKQVLSILNN